MCQVRQFLSLLVVYTWLTSIDPWSRARKCYHASYCQNQPYYCQVPQCASSAVEVYLPLLLIKFCNVLCFEVPKGCFQLILVSSLLYTACASSYRLGLVACQYKGFVPTYLICMSTNNFFQNTSNILTFSYPVSYWSNNTKFYKQLILDNHLLLSYTALKSFIQHSCRKKYKSYIQYFNIRLGWCGLT